MQNATRICDAPIRMPLQRGALLIAVATLWSIAAFAQEATIPVSDAAALLRNRYAAMSELLAQSPLRPGLHLESTEQSRTLRGDVYAIVDFTLAAVRDTFTSPENWCEVLLLHLNTKYCRVRTRNEKSVLSVAVGKKFDQPLNESHRIELAYNIDASNAEYMQVSLDAKKGPLGTKNYRVALEMVAVDVERTFVHIQYSYTDGFLSRLATNIYLGGAAKNKVGFTLVDNATKEAPRHIGGVRGALERNTMRYFLAVDAYLSTFATPQADRFAESAERWFAATERYALQLHEVDHDTYIAMKRAEYLRQQTPQ